MMGEEEKKHSEVQLYVAMFTSSPKSYYIMSKHASILTLGADERGFTHHPE
jgi:hypothetical protein